MPENNIIIVGGGPIGLYLAGRLLQQGHRCTILEKKTAIDPHSKSLGIHPVSLELFEKAGIVEKFLLRGLKIKKGLAFWNREKLGEITFEKFPVPFRYILAIPQWQTEQILQQWVESLDSGALIRQAEVLDIIEKESGVQAIYHKNGKKYTVSGKYLIGCDGKYSFSRKTAAIPFDGSPYPDSYIMGDFSDNTEFGRNAAIFLHKKGLIESFPLPNSHRRWVVKTDQRVKKPESHYICDLVKERIGHSLYEADPFMISSFGVQHFLARDLFSGRILLAGDAAHVVSPIGGQGMNLGWMGAELCFLTLKKALQHPGFHQKMFEVYSKKQRKIVKQAARRAEINMWLGRAENSGKSVELALRLLIQPPASHLLAKLFTMRGLGKWWI